MNAMCPPGLTVDDTMHGGGLHMMPPGGFLDVHLDCDLHPITRARRAMNAILFLDDWWPNWGGQLELWDERERKVEIMPRRNRLVVFETLDNSYHGVPVKIQSPPGVWRRSLAVYWWELGDWPCRRPRAQFVGVPGEKADAAKEAWRRERCGL